MTRGSPPGYAIHNEMDRFCGLEGGVKYAEAYVACAQNPEARAGSPPLY